MVKKKVSQKDKNYWQWNFEGAIIEDPDGTIIYPKPKPDSKSKSSKS